MSKEMKYSVYLADTITDAGIDWVLANWIPRPGEPRVMSYGPAKDLELTEALRVYFSYQDNGCTAELRQEAE